MFKIGELVKYDGGLCPIMARVEGFEGRKIRIVIPAIQERHLVPAGDLAHLGEDELSAQRERSARDWAIGGFTSYGRTDGHGNYSRTEVPAQAQEEGDFASQAGRH
jgi:hypothetical protein